MQQTDLETTPMRSFAIACTALFLEILSGCAATLDNASTVPLELTSPQPSEQTYRNIVGAMRRCYTVPSVRVEADYFPDAKSGSLRLVWGNDVGVIEWLRLEVSPTPSGSVVRGLHRSAQREFPPAVASWIKGDASVCPYA